jgi:hypothetical protein
MEYAGGRSRLALEPLQKAWLLAEIPLYLLESHYAIQRDVARFIDNGHTAAAQLFQNIVRAHRLSNQPFGSWKTGQ